MCAVRTRSRCSQSIHRRRSHAADGAKTRRTAIAPRKRWAAAPSRPCSLRRVWHCQIATMQPMRLLQQQYTIPCWGYRAGQTTAQTSECSTRRCGSRPATCSELAAARYQTAPSRAMALPRCVVSRNATARAESLEGAMSGHQSWAVLCRYRCRLLLAEIPNDDSTCGTRGKSVI